MSKPAWVGLFLIAGLLWRADPLWSQDAGSEPRDSAHQDLIKAQIFSRQGEHDKALALFKQLISRFPRDAEMRADYVEALLAAGRRQEAKQELALLLAASPDHRRGRYLLARVDMEEKKWAEAFSILKKLAAEDPKDPYLEADYGRAAQARGLWLTAIEAYKASLTLNPDQPALHRDLSELISQNLPRLTWRLSRLEQAAETETWRLETSFQAPLSEEVSLGLTWRDSQFSRPEDEAVRGLSGGHGSMLARLVYRHRDRWLFRLEAGPHLHGASGPRAEMTLERRLDDRGWLRGAASYNQAWDDPLEAGEKDGRLDTLTLSGQWLGLKPWVFELSAQGLRYYLYGREPYADRYIVSALAGPIIFSRPYVLLYYRFYRSEVFRQHDSPLNLLLAEESIHSLGGYLDAELLEGLSAWFSAAVRRDVARKLTAWEVGAGLRCRLGPRLTLEPSYVYTSETETVAGGESHLATLQAELLF